MKIKNLNFIMPITLIIGIFTTQPVLSNVVTLTVYKNDALESICSRRCPDIKSCINKAMEFDYKNANSGFLKKIVVKNNSKIVLMKNYSSNANRKF